MTLLFGQRQNLFSTNIEMKTSFEFPKVDFKKDIANLGVDKLAKLGKLAYLESHPDTSHQIFKYINESISD